MRKALVLARGIQRFVAFLQRRVQLLHVFVFDLRQDVGKTDQSAQLLVVVEDAEVANPVLGHHLACRVQAGVLAEGLQRAAGQLAGGGLCLFLDHQPEHVTLGQDARLAAIVVVDDHRVLALLAHLPGHFGQWQGMGDPQRRAQRDGADFLQLQKEFGSLVQYHIGLRQHAAVAVVIVDHQIVADIVMTEVDGGFAEGDVVRQGLDRARHDRRDRVGQGMGIQQVEAQYIGFRPDADRFTIFVRHQDGSADRFAHASGRFGDGGFRSTGEQFRRDYLADGALGVDGGHLE